MIILVPLGVFPASLSFVHLKKLLFPGHLHKNHLKERKFFFSPCTKSSTGCRATPSGLEATHVYVPLSDGFTSKIRRLPDGRTRYFGLLAPMGTSCRSQVSLGFGFPLTLHFNSVQRSEVTFTGDMGSILGEAANKYNTGVYGRAFSIEYRK